MRLERTEVRDGRAVGTGETFDVEVGTIITAIGYHAIAPDGVPMDGGVIANQVPLALDRERRCLWGHLARPNPQLEALAEPGAVLAVSLDNGR